MTMKERDTTEMVLEKDEEEQSVAEQETVEQDEEQQPVAEQPADTPTSPRRKWRRVILAIVALVAIGLAAAVGVRIAINDDGYRNVYLEMLTATGIDSDSSDEDIEQAMVAMADMFLSEACPAGVSIAVTRNGSRIFVPKGVLKVGGADKINQDTLFEIGSVSKPITGLVLAALITTGDLTLDTPLNDELPRSVPDLIVNGKLVTLRQLVTHTAGFPRLSKKMRDTGPEDLMKPNPYAGFTEADMLLEIGIASTELSQTGNIEYSNFGFSTLAFILARNQNMSYPALQKSWTDRLALNSTWAGSLPNSLLPNLSTGYRNDHVVPHWYDGGIFIDGAYSTVSSTSDLLTLVERYLAPDELQDEVIRDALQLSLTPLEQPNEQTIGLAFAWLYSKEQNLGVWQHKGAMPGFFTNVAFQPASKTGVVVLSNCANKEAIDIGNALSFKLFRV
jgi:D-alanyl-D-alanine-carboxypeptidase/D-alanyl-D-alanine-endopeptidase